MLCSLFFFKPYPRTCFPRKQSGSWAAPYLLSNLNHDKHMGMGDLLLLHDRSLSTGITALVNTIWWGNTRLQRWPCLIYKRVETVLPESPKLILHLEATKRRVVDDSVGGLNAFVSSEMQLSNVLVLSSRNGSQWRSCCSPRGHDKTSSVVLDWDFYLGAWIFIWVLLNHISL